MKEMIEPELLTVLEPSTPLGKWKVYEEYKDSDSDCLGNVPHHWEVRRLKYLTRLKYGDSLPFAIREEGNVLVFGSNGPVGTHTQANTSSPVIIIGRKGSFGKITFSESRSFAIDTTYYIDKIPKEVHIRWLFYILRILRLDDFSEDSAIPGLSRDYVHKQQIPLPPIEEQYTIVIFLEREIAKLNALIAHKERMITLLQERRTAVINQAVTKGLNLDVPMKDSGVEWLGEIPAHWEVRKIKYVAKFFGGGTPSKANIGYWSGNIPWVSPKDMKSEIILDTEDHISIEALKDSTTNLIQADAVLIVVRSGILKHTIPIAINSVPVTINQDIKAILPNNLLLPQYLASLIHSHQEIFLMEWRKSGATVESIEYDLLINTPISIPSLEEQKEIVESIQQKTVPIDKLITVIQEGIKKLKEYSAALISAAVTGKIDVRGEVADVQGEEAAL